MYWAGNVQLLALLSHMKVKQKHHWALNAAMPTTTENNQFCLSVSFSLQLLHTPSYKNAVVFFILFYKEGRMNQSWIYSLLSNNIKRLVFSLLLLSCLDCPAAAAAAAHCSLNEHKASLQHGLRSINKISITSARWAACHFPFSKSYSVESWGFQFALVSQVIVVHIWLW